MVLSSLARNRLVFWNITGVGDGLKVTGYEDLLVKVLEAWDEPAMLCD